LLEHILVVEDDELMRISLETELKLAGYRVSLAECGEQAIELARHEHFDLVVCDIRMPGINGIDTLNALREIQPSARNIVMTGYADADAPVQAVKLKVDDYLRKPFSADDFLVAVRKALQDQIQELKRQRVTRQLRSLLLTFGRRLGDGEAAGVAQRAAHRASRLARVRGLSPARLESLQLACWLQPLRSELGLMDDLKPIGELLELAEESWDGDGPRRWKGTQIPLEGRILRLALGQEAGVDPELLELLDENQELPEELPASSSGQPRALLALAQSYLGAGQFDLCHSALRQLLASAPEAELEARAWLTLGQLQLLQQQPEPAVDSARRAEQTAAGRGLEGVQSRAVLLRAQLGQAQPEELAQARDRLEALGDLAGVALSDLWLAISGQVEASTRLLEGLQEDSRLWIDWVAPLSQALQGQLANPLLAERVKSAGDRALGLLENWLAPSAPLELRLRALDLLAPLETPAARALLAGDFSDHPALAQKSQLLAQRGRSSDAPRLEVYLLGRLRLALGGQLLNDEGISAKKTRSLFAYLCWRLGQEVHEEVLIELFWPEAGPKGKHSLHNAIYQIRKFLRVQLGDLADDVLQLGPGPSYRLERHPALWVDSEDFLEHCQAAQKALLQQQPAQAVAELRKAELLYRGDLLEALYDEWVEPARQTTQERFAQLLSTLGRQSFEQEKYEQSLEYWKRLLQRDNCSEEAYIGCFLAQQALGRPGEAVRTYHRCAQVLRKELGLGPPPQLVEMYLKLSGDTRPQSC